MSEAGELKPRRIIVEMQTASQEEPRSKGRWSSIVAFGETKVGSAFVTLILTGIVGAVLANHFADVEKSRDRLVVASEQAAARRREYIDFAGKIISDRRLAISLVHSALIRPTFANELQKRWEDYQAAYAAYNRNTFNVQIDFSEFGRSYTHTNVFGDVLDNDITPSFTRLDHCLTQTVDHRALTIAKTRRAAALMGSQLAVADFARCGSTSKGSGWSYSDEVGRLDGCIITYRDELEWAVRTTDRAYPQKAFLAHQWLRVRRAANWAQRGFGSRSEPKLKNDWLIGEKNFWQALPGVLNKFCGPLSADKYYTPPQSQ